MRVAKREHIHPFQDKIKFHFQLDISEAVSMNVVPKIQFSGRVPAFNLQGSAALLVSVWERSQSWKRERVAYYVPPNEF